MKVLSEKKFEIAWKSFWGKMVEADLTKYFEENQLREQLKVAAGGINEESGVAYQGGLITHINITIAIAENIYNVLLIPPFNILTIDLKSLLRSLLLMHLSKIEMYVPNDNTWEIEKRGLNFKFAELPANLKFGERSILYANKLGIELSAEEFEAIRSIDKKAENNNGDAYISTLALVVRQANEIAYAFEKERNKLQ